MISSPLCAALCSSALHLLPAALHESIAFCVLPWASPHTRVLLLSFPVLWHSTIPVRSQLTDSEAQRSALEQRMSTMSRNLEEVRPLGCVLGALERVMNCFWVGWLSSVSGGSLEY